MARNLYGATAADVTVTSTGQIVPGAVLTCWDAESGGTQITDLQDASGAASTAVTSTAYGQVRFYGPDGENRALWLQGAAGTPRLMVRPAASIMPANDSIDTIHLKAGSVTSAKIADGTIVDADINAAAAIARSKISGLPTTTTDNTLPRFDGTSGALQASGVVVDDNNRLTVASGSAGGLEIGSSGVLRLSGTGDPSGVSAPRGSEWIQTDANAAYGSLVGIRWLKVGTGTTLGTDWLPDFGGRWIDYTPSCNWSNVTITGRYTMAGKLCTMRARVVVSGTTVYAGSCTLSLPRTPINNAEVRAAAAIGRVASAYYQLVALPSSDLGIYPMGASGAWGTFSSTVPATWASGNFVDVLFTYEIA